VVEVGGARVADMAALAAALRTTNGAVDLTVMRDGERTTISLPG